MTETLAITGYAHEAYAQALSEFGVPQLLPRSGGWILRRAIRGTEAEDAMGCYPLFSCANWDGLPEDLDEISDLVSFGAVADPLGNHNPELLQRAFKDVVFPYKQHMVTDLSQSPETYVAAHHRRNARKALQEIQAEVCSIPSDHLDEWAGLYDVLIQRHSIRGISAFSRKSFAAQLQSPGMVVFRARFEGQTVGMLLWYITGDAAYYHLGAYNDVGYDRRASFALFWTSIEYFSETPVKWLNLGAGAGVSADADDGLTRFKRGWTTGTRTAYFCGRIFDREKYDQITQQRGVGETKYFPAYRSEELQEDMETFLTRFNLDLTGKQFAICELGNYYGYEDFSFGAMRISGLLSLFQPAHRKE